MYSLDNMYSLDKDVIQSENYNKWYGEAFKHTVNLINLNKGRESSMCRTCHLLNADMICSDPCMMCKDPFYEYVVR